MGIEFFSMIHDSYGVLAPYVTMLRDVTKETFYEIHVHDQLQLLLDCAEEHVGKRLPDEHPARKHFDQARVLLFESGDDSPKSRCELAHVHSNLGNVLWHLRLPGEAEHNDRQAIQLLQQLVACPTMAFDLLSSGICPSPVIPDSWVSSCNTVIPAPLSAG